MMNSKTLITNLKNIMLTSKTLNTNLKELQKLSTSQLINKRYEKYRKIGQVF